MLTQDTSLCTLGTLVHGHTQPTSSSGHRSHRLRADHPTQSDSLAVASSTRVSHGSQLFHSRAQCHTTRAPTAVVVFSGSRRWAQSTRMCRSRTQHFQQSTNRVHSSRPSWPAEQRGVRDAAACHPPCEHQQTKRAHERDKEREHARMRQDSTKLTATQRIHAPCGSPNHRPPCTRPADRFG